MKSPRIIFSLVCLTFAGCGLKNAPECFTGSEMCELNETMGQALYSVCQDDGNWKVTRGCANCENNQCHDEDTIICTDGERFCKDFSENISISAICKDNSYITNVCFEGCNNDSCSSNKAKQCTDGQRACVWMDEIGHSVQLYCDHQQWFSFICASGYTCSDNLCVAPSSTEACGESRQNCAETIPGWETGVCQDQQCIPTSCTSDYHLDNHTCEKNTIDLCAANNVICSSADFEGSDIVKCVSYKGICEVDSCLTGYHIYDDRCELNSSDHCGNHDTTCTTDKFENSSEVKCTETGTCQLVKCKTGYHIYNDSCEQNSKDHCGDHDTTCSISDFFNSLEVKCTEDGVCQPSECKTNFHPYKDKCEMNSSDHCGKHYEFCSIDRYENSTEVECKNGECVINECRDEYEAITNPPECGKNTEEVMCTGGEYYSTTFNTLDGKKNLKAYGISSVETLNALRDAINSGKTTYPDNNSDKAFILCNNIVIDDADWQSIGNNYSFEVYFSGNYNTIEFTKEMNHNAFNGLFGKIMNSSIEYLTIKGSIKGNSEDIPAVGTALLAGDVYNSYIDTIIAEGNINTPKQNSVGGIIGVLASSKMIDCQMKGNVTGASYVGGLVGSSDCLDVTYCSSEGTVKGEDEVGGLLGKYVCTESKTQKCEHNHSTSNVTGTTNVGGLIGLGNETGVITRSYATGNVTASSTAGGLIGSTTNSEFENCYASGNVEATNDIAGGFVGKSSDLAKSYFNYCAAFGNVTGKANIGGFVGQDISGTVSAEHRYYDNLSVGLVKGQDKIGGFIGELSSVVTIRFNYSLGKVNNSSGGTTNTGSFLGADSNTVSRPNVNGNYHYDLGIPAVGYAINDVNYSTFKPIRFNPLNPSDSPQILAPFNGDKRITDELSPQWRPYRCQMDIGEGEKIYEIPIGSYLVPDFCKLNN